MSQSNVAQSGTKSLESRIEELLMENRRLREEASAFEARASLVSQYEEQRLMDASRFRAILNNNRCGILLLSPSGTVVEVVHPIFGYSQVQLLGHNPSEILLPDSAQPFLADLAYVVQTPGTEHQGEYCIRNAAGESRWVEAILSDRLHDPAILAIVCNYRDITDRKLEDANQSLAQSILQSTDWAILSEDPDGKVLSWNAGARELFGYAPEEIIGKNAGLLLWPERLDGDGKAKLRHKNGSPVAVRLKIAPLLDRHGKLAGRAYVASRVSGPL